MTYCSNCGEPVRWEDSHACVHVSDPGPLQLEYEISEFQVPLQWFTLGLIVGAFAIGYAWAVIG